MVLPVQITFRNFEPAADLDSLIRDQVSRLERYYSRITSCRVMLEKAEGRRRGNPYHVRIDLGMPQGELLVETEPSLRGTLQDTHGRKVAKSTELDREHREPGRAVLDAFREMRRRLQDYARKQRGAVKAKQPSLETGRVIALYPDEGYGFLETAQGRQVYFHRDAVVEGHFNFIRIGTQVQFCEAEGEKGPQASTVKLEHLRKQARKASDQVPLVPRRGARR